MSRIFIFDNCPDTVRTLRFYLEGEGHQVLSNMEEAGALTKIELRPTDVLKKMLGWRPLPDIVLVECLDVDSEFFIRMLKSLSIAQQMVICAMTHRYPNSRINRLMSSYGVHCLNKPFNVAKLEQQLRELISVSASR
ncbi:MAG: hypothetical protein PHO91_03525 [Patescibacteria group bacterium]|nr:hypothetical protein [Patescibacteria group bacterium]